MKRSALLLAVLFCCSTALGCDPPKRPRIFGIEGVSIYVSDAHKARAFYDALLDQDQCSKHPKRSFWREKPSAFSLNMSPNRFQFIGLEPAHSPAPSNLIAEVTFLTDNVAALRSYLLANLTDTRSLTGPGMKYLSLTDPEGHKISFLETDGVLKDPKIIAILTKGGYENEIIHAGFIVRDRAATEHFYKDLLGFNVYWHGGMKDDQTDWVSMQVPDGTDWVEFMVNVPLDANQGLRGIMNHIAIGVTDIHATQKKLIENGVKLTEQPKIGRDGKWQLNLYDPDDTRVEFMEFKPVQKPCCSDYTGPHPKP